nr:MAG TPA: hypothetical protein [Caudoviricetes sp.]
MSLETIILIDLQILNGIHLEDYIYKRNSWLQTMM